MLHTKMTQHYLLQLLYLRLLSIDTTYVSEAVAANKAFAYIDVRCPGFKHN